MAKFYRVSAQHPMGSRSLDRLELQACPEVRGGWYAYGMLGCGKTCPSEIAAIHSLLDAEGYLRAGREIVKV